MIETNSPTSICNDNDACFLSPILPDELAKTDSVHKSLSKSLIRNTFYRSVSFMKKSFNRSNSSLSMSSLQNESTRSMTMEDSSMLVSDDGSGAFRSCMKGSRKINNTSRSLRVRFKRSHDKIIKIEPFFEYASDLWYTKKDERENFSQPGLETAYDAANAEMYMKAYTQARKEVYPANWFDMKDPQPAKPEKLSTSLYDEIVEGRIHGFAGLEQYSANLKKTRRVHIQQTVLMIASAYYDSISSIDGSVDVKEKLVRSYAKTLTAVDRYWSAAIGQADADAAAEVYNEFDPCYDAIFDSMNQNNSGEKQ